MNLLSSAVGPQPLPIDWYRRDSTGVYFPKFTLGATDGERSLTFFSLAHIASRTFFEDTSKQLALVPATILREGVETDTASTPEGGLIGAHRTNSVVLTAIAREMGLDLVDQRSVLMYPVDRVKTIDLGSDEIARRLTASGFDFSMLVQQRDSLGMLEAVLAGLQNPATANAPEVVNPAAAIVAGLEKRLLNPVAPATASPNDVKFFDVVYRQREDVLVDAIATTPGDLAIPWGAHHSLRVAARLVATGRYRYDRLSLEYRLAFKTSV